MKQLILTLALMLSLGAGQAQTTRPRASNQEKLTNNHLPPQNYELYPTKNIWTFLKLDTRNGKIWQVHFSINSETEVKRRELPLDLDSKTWLPEDEVPGRFALYPTENIYTFILLDKTNGNTFQAQWNHEMENRAIIAIKAETK